MERSTHLGVVDEILVLTYGEPGERTFNITAESGRGTAVVWLEKEQLYNIASSLADVISQIDSDQEVEGPPFTDYPEDSDGDIEFKAVQIALRYEDGRKLFVFAAAGVDTDRSEEGSEDPDALIVQFGFSHRQAVYVARHGLEIVAAGRPICAYCGTAINQGEEHECTRRNGHHADHSAEAIENLLDEEEEGT